jgi:leader peptidase (prepilin peptidase)/N-methyltransferase
MIIGLATGAIGLVVGSFLNVCIYRLPRDQSVFWPGSHCPACGHVLAWFENIPVLSWLGLRGRCRTCHAAIPVTYLLVEVATCVLFLAALVVYGLTPLLVVRLAFLCALVVLFVIDYQYQYLPDAITLPGIVVGFVASLFLPPGWTMSVLGFAVGGLFPFLIAEGYVRLRGREGMGMGDFKMLAMVGAFLGWPLVWVILIVACVLGIVIGGGVLLATQRGLATRLPFGAFIALAALIGVLAEGLVLRAYDAVISAYQELAFWLY